MAKEVAIVGAGIAGLTLALALHDQGIHSTVYESRDAPLNIGGAVMLSPNSLKILDQLGIFDRLKTHGYSFETLYYRSAAGELKETQEFGSMEKYGYSGLRVYRFQLIDALLDMIKDKNIILKFGHKFSHVVQEEQDKVTWQFTDGTAATASLLVGADGIHSRVRRYLYPDLVPKFTGMAGVTAAVEIAQVKLPSPGYQLPVTIIHPSAGAFVMAPQKPDGSEVLIGKQKRMPELSREEWDRIHADKDASIAFLQANNEPYGDIAISATSFLSKDKINIWPFYIIPRLPSWASDKKRVLLVGDSAHAVPPSSGQGINQAVEDVAMLSLLLGKGRGDAESLAFWQKYRQDRVDEVLKLNAKIDRKRMPKLTGARGAKDDESLEDMSWLYGIDLNTEVERYVSGKSC